MNMSSIYKFLLANLFAFLCLCLNAQGLSKGDIDIKSSSSLHQGRVVVSYIKNNFNDGVIVRFTNEYGTGGPVSISLRGGESRTIDITCNIVEAKPQSGGKFIDLLRKPKEQEPLEQDEKKDEKNVQTPTPSVVYKSDPIKIETKAVKSISITKRGPLTIEEIIPDFYNYLESIPFLASSSIEDETSKIDEHLNSLRNWKDKDAYISEHHLNSYINSICDSLVHYSHNTTSLITNYIEKYGNKEITNKAQCIDSIQAIVMQRLGQRETNINRLSEEINSTSETESFEWQNLDWKLIGICAGVFLFLVILILWFRKANKKNKTTTLSNINSIGSSDASSAIVVRRKTTSILRKQSLEDVIDNDAYMELDCNDFCADSAVRRMYIKNTCIKDIYNMYAEDLRNPNNPKEDGCMVLGRWVHDDQSNEYYVSLEHIVLPGDDAVFSEYELNFGGKIKLKVTEKLRKLRRETNLQYDLTCWVHSHPGLGVFFSNSDSNVQMQLKHPTHPNFLTAIVVDILTPQQEMGIFTFKRDSSINSKADLKKLYSLEELYKWAVESDRNSFKPEDYYNTLGGAKSHQNECYGIELSNGSIIDMGMLVAETDSGLAGMIHGFSNQHGLMTEHVASTVSKNESVPDNELIGCFVIATHCSIPSIRKVITNYIGKIKFVLVYTTTDGLLTSIPIINQDICTDEKYYGEQKLEDLKIWTRRKR